MASLQSGEGQQPPLDAVATDASTAKAKGRLVKTPLQKEVLEASFNLDANPTQQHRKALAERLQLTEEQVQAWFVARRRKDKKKAGDGTPGLSEAAAGADAGGGGGASDAGAADEAGGSGSTADAAQAELLELAKSALYVPFREDGPPLAIIFDTVPGPNTKKGMQAAALIAARKRKLADAAGGGGATEAAVASEPAGAAAASEGQPPAAKRPKIEGTVLESMAVDAQQRVLLEEALQQQAALHASSTQKPKASQQASSAGAGGREAMKADRLKAAAEARQAKELAKARAAQEREAKKREAATERERKAEEKRKAAEEKRREKEMARAMMQQERTARGTSHHHGPPDDLDLEYEALLVRARATAAAQAAARGLDASAVEPVVPPRPEFPPPYLLLQPAFPPELSEELGPQLIEAWGFVTGFADLLGMPAVSMEALLSALMQGSSSPLLGLVHVLLLRQAQADMEISHATGCLQDPHPADRALVAAATRLEEAWAWGLDPDLWRAHLGPRTWPEVLRQQAIAGGAGGSRVQLKRLAAAAAAGDGAPGAEGSAAASTKSGKGRGPKGAMGYEGEDVVSGWTGDGPLKLLLPVRFGDSTWMAAAWKVLSEAGPEGLPVAEVVRRITERGYRNMAGSKNPEASVTGALSRDVLFTRLGPAIYALASIVTYTQRMQAAGKPAVIEPPLHQQAAAGAAGAVAEQDSDDEDSDDEDEVVAAAPEDPPDAAPWVNALKHGPYDSLGLDQRLAALLWLCGIVGDGLGVRNLLESREKEVAALKKQILEDTRAEKKRRQDEAAARARAASQEAQRRLEQLQRQAAAGEAVPAEAMAAAAAAAATLSAAAGLPPPGPSAASAASRAATPTPPAGPGAAGLPPTAPSAPTSPSPGAAATAAAGAAAAAAAEGSTPPSDQQRQKTPPADAAAGAAGAGAPSGSAQQGGATGQQADGSGAAAGAAAGQTPEQLQQQKQAEAEATAESARRAARAEAIRRLEELNVLRLEPLGLDRRFNRYWLLCCPDFSITSCYTGEADDLTNNTGSIPGMPPDANAGRIWVESADSGRWRLLLRPQQLDQLKQVLEPRGAREGGLHSSLLRVEGAVRAAMPGRPFQMPTRLDELPAEKQQAAAEAHLRWLQRQPLLARLFTSQQQEDSIRALTQPRPAAAAAAAEPNGAEVEMQLVAADGSSTTADPDVVTLKQDMLRVEALVADALQAAAGAFQHDEWVQAVSSAPDLLALRSCLAQLEAALVSSNSQAVAGSKGSGRQLLDPDWARVIAATPAVKGAWLQCGAEVAAAVLDSEGLLTPNMTGTAAAAAGPADEGTDPAAAAAAPVALQSEQQLEQQQQQRAQQRASLAWLPATVPSLSLRLAALDASVCYPQLQQDLGCVAGRPITAAYHYIVKPCSIFDPPTLDQLLLQEKEAAAAAKDKQQQQQQQPTASGSASATPAAEEQDGSPQSHSKQQQQEQQQPQEQQEEEVAAQEPEKLKQPAAASDILALVHPTPKPKQQQQQQQQQQKQLQAARKQQRTKPRQNVPTLEGVLEKPLRVAYGYSLQGRGLLQLIRGLPPFPDWLQKARLDEFKLPVSSMRAAVKAAQEDGTIGLTLEQIRDAAAAKERAKAEAAAAAEAVAAAAGSEEGEWGHDEAAGHHQQGGKAAAGRGKPPAKAPGKGGLKLKLNMGKAGKGAAAAGDGPSSKAAAAAAGKQKGDGAAAGGQPKLKLKFKSRESSPTRGAAPAKAGGKAPGSGGRLRLKQTAQLHQDQQAGGDMSRKERMMRQLGLRTATEAELAEEVQQLQDYSDDDD